MNKWINFFDEIFVINLLKRQDRLLRITEDFEQYEIPFTRINAIENGNGAEGLKDTMIGLFTESIQKGYKNILVFEDDCMMKNDPFWFNDTMDKVVKQIPENYIMCFLGCQITSSISHFHSPNIIKGNKMFSTHAVMYSLQGMKEILSQGITAPIDNFYVDTIEKMGNSYATYPLLCSQYPGYSDIGKSEINWDVFITPRYAQKIAEMNHGR